MDRHCFAAAMGQFQRPELVRQALAYALESSLRPQEFFAVLQSIFGSEEWRDLLLDWLLEHYPAVVAKIPSTFVAFLPRYANGGSEARLEKAERFFARPENAVAGTARELAKIREAVHHTLNLREGQGAAVVRFLERL